MHFQGSLPRLPIPKLEDTYRRYLDAQKPLLTPEQYERVKEVTKNFIEYEGRALNAELVAKDNLNKNTSYVSEPWYDMYLRYRKSIVLNHNPFIVFNRDPNTSDPLVRATKMLHAAVRFKKSFDKGLLAPDVYHLNPKKSDTKFFRSFVRLLPSSLSWYGAYLFKAFPLDMSQYKRLFNSTRIPLKEKDSLESFPADRHILVIRNGHFFTFDLLKQDGSVVSKDEIYANLKAVVEQSAAKNENSCGVLTAEERDYWAELRARLKDNTKNAEILRKIDGALFVLCLDDRKYSDEYEAMRMFLHGVGGDRWFDKSFQLILEGNAEAAINFEHAWGDGVSIVRFFNEIHEHCIKEEYQPSAAAPPVSSLAKHEFLIDKPFQEILQQSQKRFQEFVGKLKLFAREEEEFGKNFFKANRLSADGVMQLAFQMAYYRMFGCASPTYESCSTAAFKHGRTETLRPATTATVACSEAFDLNHPAGIEEMVHLVRNSSDMHGKLTKEAAMGQGFDRHLFALKTISEKSGRNVDFFQDEAYLKMNHIILSTSTVSSPNIRMGGFAPVTPNGLGVGYMILDEKLGCNVSAYPDSPSCTDFVELVFKSLRDIYNVFQGHNFKK
eukprot:gene2490-18153_t